MAQTTVAWNPFAREGIERFSWSGDDRRACAWCGQKSRRVMFSYGREDFYKQFCNLDCYRCYAA